MKLLKFYAEWCGPCSALSLLMESIKDQILVPVENIDIDVDTAAPVKYNIRSLPTLVLVDNEGNELRRVTGSKNKQQLLNFL